MRRSSPLPLAALAAASLFLASAPSRAELHAFAALPIEGSQEVPAISSTGSGTINAIYDDVSNTLRYNFSWTLDAGSTSLDLVHFHGPAMPGVSTGVAIGLGGFSNAASGNSSGSVTLTEGQEAELLGGLWYINLHSDQHGGGELRGQMVETAATHAQEAAQITGDQETPAVSTTGAGLIWTVFDDATGNLTFAYEWSALTGPVTMTHFHGPGAAGVMAGVQIGLSGFDMADSGMFAGTVNLDAAQEADLLNGLWYINLHTAMHGGGEIRGQLNLTGVTAVSEWAAYE